MADVPRKTAVLALIMKGDLILSVSRKDDVLDLGLPGGKVEPGETLEDALKREIHEETGLHIISQKAIFLRQDADFDVWTFSAEVEDDSKIRTTELGKVEWATLERLVAGSFGAYNKNLFVYLGMLES